MLPVFQSFFYAPKSCLVADRLNDTQGYVSRRPQIRGGLIHYPGRPRPVDLLADNRRVGAVPTREWHVSYDQAWNFEMISSLIPVTGV